MVTAVEHSAVDFRRMVEVNLTGSFIVALAAAAEMLKQPRPDRCRPIVLMGSIQGKVGMALGSAYFAAKAGVTALAKSMAKDLAAENITFNAAPPVATETTMVRQITAERSADILPRIPIGALRRPRRDRDHDRLAVLARGELHEGRRVRPVEGPRNLLTMRSSER